MDRRAVLKLLASAPIIAALSALGMENAMAKKPGPNFPSEGVGAQLRALLPKIDVAAGAGGRNGPIYAQIAALIRTLGP